jgi:hypothetical protein
MQGSREIQSSSETLTICQDIPTAPPFISDGKRQAFAIQKPDVTAGLSRILQFRLVASVYRFVFDFGFLSESDSGFDSGLIGFGNRIGFASVPLSPPM